MSKNKAHVMTAAKAAAQAGRRKAKTTGAAEYTDTGTRTGTNTGTGQSIFREAGKRAAEAMLAADVAGTGSGAAKEAFRAEQASARSPKTAHTPLNMTDAGTGGARRQKVDAALETRATSPGSTLWDGSYTPAAQSSSIGRHAEGYVSDVPKTYASYHDAKKDADALTRERDQKKRQFTQMYGWRMNAAALPGYAEAQDELDSLNARLGAALDFMSTHASELADGHSAIHIQGDAAGYEERVAAMRRERDAYAAGDQVDPSRLYRMDRQLARWQKAVDEAKEKESGSATKDVSAQYSDAMSELARLKGIEEAFKSASGVDEYNALLLQYGMTGDEAGQRASEMQTEINGMWQDYANAAFAERGYPEWDGTDYTPESVAENWDRILALASLDVLTDTQKKEARNAAKALKKAVDREASISKELYSKEEPDWTRVSDYEAVKTALSAKAGTALPFGLGAVSSFPFGEQLVTQSAELRNGGAFENADLSDETRSALAGTNVFAAASANRPGAFTVGNVAGNIAQMAAAGQAVGAATAGAEAALGAAELGPWASRFANMGLHAARTGTTMATVEGLQSAGRQDWSDPGTALRNTGIDTGIAAVGGSVGGAVSGLASAGVENILVKNGWQTAFDEFVRNATGSMAFTTGNAATRFGLKTAAANALGESYGEAPTAQEFEQELLQGFLFSVISSGIETISSTAKAKAEMDADVSELQRDVDDLLHQTDMQNPEDAEHLAGDAYRRIAELEDRIGSTYYAGQQDAVDDALRSLDELGRMIEDAYPDVDLGDGMAAKQKAFDEFLNSGRMGSSEDNTESPKLKRIKSEHLNPTQGRTLSRKEFAELVSDIKENGIIDPIKCVRFENELYVVDGHHRLLAAKALGMESVPIEEVQLPYKGYKSVVDLFDW